MKKSLIFGMIALLAASLVFMACPPDGGDPDPTVTKVEVTPATVEVAKGTAQQFDARVTGDNSPGQGVTWTIEATSTKHADTKIVDGLLTVAGGETNTTLTVRATSTVDTTKSGTATVTVVTDNTPPVYISAAIDGTKKIVTLTFSEAIVNASTGTDDAAKAAALKTAVTFASDGTNFAALGSTDTVAIGTGTANTTLIVTFSSVLTGAANKIKVANEALKDAAGNKTAAVETDPIDVAAVNATVALGGGSSATDAIVTLTLNTGSWASVGSDLEEAFAFSAAATGVSASAAIDTDTKVLKVTFAGAAYDGNVTLKTTTAALAGLKTLTSGINDLTLGTNTAVPVVVAGPPVITDKAAAAVATINGDNLLTINVTGGTLKTTGLKLYVDNATGKAVTLTTATSAPAGYTAVLGATVSGTPTTTSAVFSITAIATANTAGGGKIIVAAATGGVVVTVAVDAQATQVTSATAAFTTVLPPATAPVDGDGIVANTVKVVSAYGTAAGTTKLTFTYSGTFTQTAGTPKLQYGFGTSSVEPTSWADAPNSDTETADLTPAANDAVYVKITATGYSDSTAVKLTLASLQVTQEISAAVFTSKLDVPVLTSPATLLDTSLSSVVTNTTGTTVAWAVSTDPGTFSGLTDAEADKIYIAKIALAAASGYAFGSTVTVTAPAGVNAANIATYDVDGSGAATFTSGVYVKRTDDANIIVYLVYTNTGTTITLTGAVDQDAVETALGVTGVTSVVIDASGTLTIDGSDDITLSGGKTITVGSSAGANILIKGNGAYGATSKDLVFKGSDGSLTVKDGGSLTFDATSGVYFNYGAAATDSAYVLALTATTDATFAVANVTGTGSGPGTIFAATAASTGKIAGDAVTGTTGDVITLSGSGSTISIKGSSGVTVSAAVIDVSTANATLDIVSGGYLILTGSGTAGASGGIFTKGDAGGKAAVGNQVSNANGTVTTAIAVAAIAGATDGITPAAANGHITSTGAAGNSAATAGAAIIADVVFVADTTAAGTTANDQSTKVIVGTAKN